MNNLLSSVRSFSLRTSKKLGYRDDKQGITWIEWTLLGLLTAFCFFAFYYVDMDSIIDNTVLFVHSITEGKFTDFYKYSMENASTWWAANYEIPVYILFAIWNLPTIILGYFMPVTYLDNIFCILWAKLMIMVFLALAAYMIYKIVRLAGHEKKRAIFAAYLFASSSLMIMFTNVMPQMDIIPVFFMLWGMYYYLKGNMRAFTIVFAIAIPLKMFALFVFVPLVLLKVKNVFKIIGYAICGMSVQLLCKLIYHGSAEYGYAIKSNTNSVINRLAKGNIIAANCEIPMFIVILCAVCIYCYAVKKENKNDFIRVTCYVPLVIFSAMFIFFSTNTYWAVLLVPFMILAIMLTPKHLKLNLFLEIGAGATYILHCFCYSTTFTLVKETYDKMILNRVFPLDDGMQRQFSSIKDLFKSYSLIRFDNIFFAAFVACLIALLITCYPKKNVDVICNTEKIEYSVIYARFLVVVALVGMVTYSYLKPINKPVVNSTKGSSYSSYINVADEKNTISQNFKVSKDIKASQLTLKFDNNANNRKDMGNIHISIENSEGKTLFEKIVGTSVIQDEKDCNVRMSGILLDDEQEYTLVITGEKYNNKKPTCVIVTDSTLNNMPSAELNGKAQDYSLYMKIR